MSLPRRVALGSMPGKAAAIAPPLARLGLTVVVPEGLDTDRFGTLTGEVPRAGTMVEAARANTVRTRPHTIAGSAGAIWGSSPGSWQVSPPNPEVTLQEICNRLEKMRERTPLERTS